MKKEHLTSGDKIRYMICDALLERGFGRALHTLAAAVQHTGLNGTTLHLEGAAMSPSRPLTPLPPTKQDNSSRSPLRRSMSPRNRCRRTQSSQPLITRPPAGNNRRFCPLLRFVAHKPEPDAAAAAEPDHGEADRTRTGGPQDQAPFLGVPADGAHYMAFKERTRQEDEEGRKQQEAAGADPAGYPGGQIPMNELQPDKVNIDQGPMEVLRFGRITG